MSRSLVAGDLVLCSGTIGRAPFDVAVRAAAAAGFQGVSVYFDDYRAVRSRGWSDADLRALLDDQGVAVAELDGRMNWLPGDIGDTRAPGMDEFVAAGGALGARSITVLEVRGRRIGDQIPFDIAASAFATVCDRAAEHGLLAHIEYFPFSGMSDILTAYEVSRRADRPNGGVMVDLWHHLRGPDDGRLDLGVPGAAVLAVQVGDVTASPSADLRAEMMHDRVLPGEGAGEVAKLLRALRDQGCTAPMEVEVYSDDLAALDHHDAARRAGDALRAVLAVAGVT